MIHFSHALRLAESIEAELLPMCERIQIAGSIRRRRPYVNDIDLVILPKPGQTDAIKARCEQRSRVVIDGPQNYIVAMGNGVQLDIFFARPCTRDLLQSTPGNFGTLLLCRTGSREHNIHLIEHSKTLGLTWNPQQGVIDASGNIIAAESEEGIFKALGLDYIQPSARER
jgi:DNA polymerase (family 10)